VSSRMNDVALRDRTFLAVGVSNFPVTEGQSTYAAQWHSNDGLTWTRDLAEDVPLATMGRLAVGPTAVVTLGNEFWLEPAGSPLWTSVDGTTWTRVPTDDLKDPAGGRPHLADVAARPDGFVAVGWQRNDPLCGPGLAWTSSDGQRWAAAAALPDAAAVCLRAAGAAPDGTLVAVGNITGVGVRVWTS